MCWKAGKQPALALTGATRAGWGRGGRVRGPPLVPPARLPRQLEKAPRQLFAAGPGRAGRSQRSAVFALARGHQDRPQCAAVGERETRPSARPALDPAWPRPGQALQPHCSPPPSRHAAARRVSLAVCVPRAGASVGYAQPAQSVRRAPPATPHGPGGQRCQTIRDRAGRKCARAAASRVVVGRQNKRCAGGGQKQAASCICNPAAPPRPAAVPPCGQKQRAMRRHSESKSRIFGEVRLAHRHAPSAEGAADNERLAAPPGLHSQPRPAEPRAAEPPFSFIGDLTCGVGAHVRGHNSYRGT